MATTDEENSLRQISATFSVIIQLSLLSRDFWDALNSDKWFGEITQRALFDRNQRVRRQLATVIEEYMAATRLVRVLCSALGGANWT
jgi:hypothetical protein